jgi:hypothetical protein
MNGDDTRSILAPQQPVRPFWMGDFEQNMLWSVIQGDALCYFIQLFCGCLSTGASAPDITNYVFLFTIKPSLDPSDPNMLLQVIWNAQHGTCGATALIVLPSQTALLPSGRYAFDLKYRTPSGMLIQTIARGEIDVLPSTNFDLAAGIPLPTSSPMIQQGRRQFAAGRLLSY